MPTTKRRAGFLVEGLGRSGGMSVVRRYAAHLAAQERWEAVLIVTGRDTEGLPREEQGVPIVALPDADGEWDVLIATWWTTTEALWSLPATRQVLFMQGIEHRFYREEEWPDRLAAMTVLDLPVDYIVVSDYMVALLRDLRPDAQVVHVPNAIDKEIFAPSGQGRSRDASEPLRVLVEGQPTLWFKGIDAALRSVRLMQRPATVTLAVHDLDDAEGALEDVSPDRVVSEPDAAAMAQLYNEHDVLLKTSLFEGFGLPVLEALHTGTPVITTPYTGHDALVKDWVNGLVVDFGDEAATAEALDMIATDRELLARLGAGATATMRDWPSAGDTAGQLEAALERVIDRDPKPPDAALDALMKRRRVATALAREAFRRQLVALTDSRAEEHRWRHEYEQAQKAAAHELSVAEARLEELQSIREQRAYRAALAVRRVLRAVWPRR